MMAREWVLDASSHKPGFGDLFCFCPVERDADGEITAIITGMMYLSDRPPHGEPMIAVVHEDGQEAVEAFCEQYADAIERIRHPS